MCSGITNWRCCACSSGPTPASPATSKTVEPSRTEILQWLDRMIMSEQLREGSSRTILSCALDYHGPDRGQHIAIHAAALGVATQNIQIMSAISEIIRSKS